MAALVRYIATMVLLLYVYGTVGYLLEGQGPIAFIAGAFALVWVGWISVLFGLPAFLVLVWALPRAAHRFGGARRPIMGLVVGFVVWAIYAALVGGVVAASGAPSPGEPPPTPLTLTGSGLAVGLVGALLGLIESIASGHPRRVH
jgi:hypothetical protein